MNRFLMGSAMGLMVGAGLMMMPGSRRMQRKLTREAVKMKRLMHRM